MKIYIVAKFENVDNYREVKSLLEDKGHTITCDWTKHKKIQSYSDNSELCRRQSSDDIQGIKDAEMVVVLYNDIKGTGMSFEIGYAYALNKKVIIVGENCEEYSMFVHLEGFILCKSIGALMSSLQTISVLSADNCTSHLLNHNKTSPEYRLPFINELRGVFINNDEKKIFENFDYWSGSTYGHENFAETFDTYYGTSKLASKVDEYYVIGVRDTNKGLEWSITSPFPMTWDAAKIWVENLNMCKKEICNET